MAQLEPTTTVTVADKEYKVQDLPEQVQRKVEIYDIWRNESEDLRIELVKCDAAMREFGNQIARDVQAWESESAEQAEEVETVEGTVEPAVETEARATKTR
jgi:hypothetical protein